MTRKTVSSRSKRQARIEREALAYVLSRGLGPHFLMSLDMDLTKEETENIGEQPFLPASNPTHCDLLTHLQAIQRERARKEEMPKPQEGEAAVHTHGTVKVMTTNDEYREVGLSNLDDAEFRDGKLVVD